MIKHARKSVITTLSLMVGLSASMTRADGASFDCAKAETSVEKLICSNAELSQLDKTASDRYLELLKTSASATELKKTQRAWLKARNQCGDVDCLKNIYGEHLTALANVAADSSSNPVQQTKDNSTADPDIQPFTVVECPRSNVAVKPFLEKSPSLAQMNHFLTITYKTALSLEKSDEAKSKITKEQCDWQTKTATCVDENCYLKNYQERLQKLSLSNLEKSEREVVSDPCPEAGLMTSEKDKAFCVKRLASRYNMVFGDGPYIKAPSQAQFCKEFFPTFSVGSDEVRYIEPLVHTDDPKNSLLKPFYDCGDYQGERDLNTFTILDFCHGFRRYQLPQLSKNAESKTEWIYQEGCGGVEPTHYTNVNFKNCQKGQQLLLNTPRPSGINGLIEHQSKYYMFEILNHKAIFLYPYDPRKTTFSPHPECIWENKTIADKQNAQGERP